MISTVNFYPLIQRISNKEFIFLYPCDNLIILLIIIIIKYFINNLLLL